MQNYYIMEIYSILTNDTHTHTHTHTHTQYMNNHLYRAPQCTLQRIRKRERKKTYTNTSNIYIYIYMYVYIRIYTYNIMYMYMYACTYTGLTWYPWACLHAVHLCTYPSLPPDPVASGCLWTSPDQPNFQLEVKVIRLSSSTCTCTCTSMKVYMYTLGDLGGGGNEPAILPFSPPTQFHQACIIIPCMYTYTLLHVQHMQLHVLSIWRCSIHVYKYLYHRTKILPVYYTCTDQHVDLHG